MRCLWAVPCYRRDVHRHLLTFSIKVNVCHTVALHSAPNSKRIMLYRPALGSRCAVPCEQFLLRPEDLRSLLLLWPSLLIDASLMLSLLTLGKVLPVIMFLLQKDKSWRGQRVLPKAHWSVAFCWLISVSQIFAAELLSAPVRTESKSSTGWRLPVVSVQLQQMHTFFLMTRN